MTAQTKISRYFWKVAKRTAQSLFFVALAFVVFTVSSCDPKGPTDIATPVHHFEEMNQKIKDKIAPYCVGMGYTIIHNGVLKGNGSAGKRVLPVDGLDLPYTPSTRQTIFSITKTLTAAATMAFLDMVNKTPDEPIKPYFPASWDVDDFPSDITFGDLMRHESGLRGTIDGYNGMKNYIEAGVFASRAFSYENINFTLLRLLVPMLSNGARTAVNNGSEPDIDAYLSDLFVNIVRTHCTNLSGTDLTAGPTIWDMTDIRNATRLYDYSNQNTPGNYIINTTMTDFTRLSGAGGWYLNSKEMAMFIDELMRGELTSRIDVPLMKSRRYGVYFAPNNTAGIGDFYEHNGASGGTGVGGRTQWIYLEAHKITVVVLCNSANNAAPLLENLRTPILEAIEESYHI